jgi:hypothetical protein
MGRRTMAVVATMVVVLGGLGAAPAAWAGMVSEDPDTTYQANDRVLAVVYVGSTVYIGGKFTQVMDHAGKVAVRNHLAAFDASGNLLGWNPNASSTVYSLVYGNGVVYAGGAFTKVSGKGRKHVAAIDPTTGTPTSFKPPSGVDKAVYALAATSSRVYIGGDFVSAGSYLAALNPTSGALDAGFAPQPPDKGVRALALSSDGGKLLVGGNFTTWGGAAQNHMTAVSPTSGALVTWKGHPGYPILGLAVDAASGEVFGAGAGTGGHVPAWNQSDGTQIWSAQTDGNVEAVALLDGVLYVGGHFNNYCDGGGYHGGVCDTPIIRHHLLAITSLTTGTIDSVWNPNVDSVLGVYALGGQGTGPGAHLGVGGDFQTINGNMQEHFAQLTEA